MLRISSILLVALLSFSTGSFAENSSLHQWYEFYQQKLKTDQEAALHLLNQRYSALSPSGEKLYISGLLFDYLSKRNQPYYGGSQRSDSVFAQQEKLYIDALLNRKNSQYDLAIDKFTTLLRDQNTNNDIEKKELFLYQLCYTLNEQGDLYKAKHYCSQLEQLMAKSNETLLPTYLSYRVIANNYSFRGESHLAIANYQQMLRVLPLHSDRSGAYNDIGAQLRELGQYKEAEKYLVDALEIRSDSDSLIERAQVLHSLAQLYRDWQKPTFAIRYYRQALEILEQERYVLGLVMTYLGLGSVYVDQGKYQEGQQLLQKALNEAENSQNYRLAAKVHYRFSVAHLKENNTQLALEHARYSYQTALEMNWFTMQAKASLQLSEIYSRLGEHEKAHDFHKRYAQLELEQRDHETTRAIEALDFAQQHFDYQLQIAQLQNDNDKKLIEIQNYQQTKSLYSLLAAASIIIVCVFFINNHQKRKQAQIDPMTGALSRGAAIRLIRQTPSSKTTHCNNILILFDLDNFKTINDQYGHPTGDQLLIHISKTLLAELSHGDLLGRLGGEEFVVMLKEVEDIDVQFRVEKLHKLINESAVITPNHSSVSITASLSYLATSRALSDFDELYSILDQALYQAKKSGRNTIVDAYNEPIER
ncbi:GGDEF domain-containing protein [Vibrio vulnificus]|nr:GGDEF domain-containing protein [Vibrio vulnificus]